MADTTANIKVTRGEWRDIYALSLIPVGTKITVENVGDTDVWLAVAPTKPPNDFDKYAVLCRKGDGVLTNSEGDSGAWVFSNNADAKINVTRTKAISGFHPLLASDFYEGLGSGIKVDATGTQKVSNDFTLFHSYFTFDIPPSMWQIKEDGVFVRNQDSTRITSVDGRAVQTSGATAGNTSSLESRRHPRYQPDRGVRYSASIAFIGANNNGILQAGLHIPGENGAYFKTKGDGNLYACILKGGVETHEELITPPFAVDYTKGNIYKIQMLWHGMGVVRFFIDNPATGYPQLVHVITFLNTLSGSVYTENPAMPAVTYAENVTEEVQIACGSIDITAEGGYENKAQYGSHFTDKSGISAPAGPIIAIRSPDTIGGWTNTRDVRLVRISVTADKKSTVILWRTRDPAAITGGTWLTQIDGSFLEFNDTMTSVNTALMDDVYPFVLEANVRNSVENPDLVHIDFVIVHGDHLVLTLENGATVQVRAVLEIGEEI